jgi:hypothetical protein
MVINTSFIQGEGTKEEFATEPFCHPAASVSGRFLPNVTLLTMETSKAITAPSMFCPPWQR